MEHYRDSLVLIGVVVLIVLGISFLTWINYVYIGQNFSDQEFMVVWMGTRQFLIEGISPYVQAEPVSVQLPPLYNDRSGLQFTYPFYTVLFVAPFAAIGDYLVARVGWMTTLEVAIIGMVFITISFSRWKIHNWMLGLLIVFSLLWYYALLPVINGNPSVLVALFIAATFLAIRQELDALTGFLLALTTIKPPMVILLIAFVLLWAISQRRFMILWSFLGSMALLTIGGLFFEPGWILQNVRQVLSAPGIALPGTPGAIIAEWLPGVGKQIGWLLTIIFTLILIWEWRAAWKKGYKWFLWTACLTLVLTNLIGIRTAAANYIALYPALILIFALWDQRWGRKGRITVVICMLILFLSLWWLFLNTLIQADQPIQHPIVFFPLPILLLIGLYWVRWQAIRNPSPMLEAYRNVNDIGDS